MTVKVICASHTPLMDHVETDPAVDAEVRGHFMALAREVEDYDPELVIVFAPDHLKCIFYNLMPPFTVGVRATSIGDYDIGGGELDVPDTLAVDCFRALHQSGVDAAISYKLQVDHGFAQILELVCGSVDRYKVIPIHINCAASPLPPFERVQKLGQAVGSWAQAQKLRVLILGSGGLSHDPPVPKLSSGSPEVVERLIEGYAPSVAERRQREEENYQAARELARGGGESLPLNPDWDQAFMANLNAGHTNFLDDVSEEELTRVAGCGGHEVRNWIAAYSALSASGPHKTRHIYYKDISAGGRSGIPAWALPWRNQ